MKPHEQRVVDERAELSERLSKLDAFIASDVFKTVDEDSRRLLLEQRHYMGNYANVLSLRIALFKPDPALEPMPGES